jgi:hypothetical protein
VSAKNPRVTASAGALGQIKLDPKYRGTQDVDPLVLAAQMFQPRSTDSFEKWAREKLGSWLNPAQVLINESIIRNRYTAVPSCHAAGKSFFAACKTGHFIDSHPIGSAFVVTTAPTSAQIESVLWRELHRVHAKAELRGRLTRSGYPQWRVGDELIAFGRRPTEIASFQGIHARFILIVLDEADGIDEQLWIAADTLASSGQARVLAIGNPDGSDTHFSRVCRPGSGWNVVRIDGLRTPNFTERGVALYPELKQYMIDNDIPFSDEAIKHVPELVKAEWRDMLLSPEWVHERMQRWGVRRDVDENKKVKWTEPALWLSKVRGRSPTEGSEGIIPLRWVELAIERWMEWDAIGRPKLDGRVVFGGDIADSGKDETVISHRVGYSIIDFVRTPLQDTDTTAKRLAARLRSSPEGTACIDGSGIGAGVVNQLRGLTLPVISFVGASSAEGVTDQTGEFTFANKRTAAYWHLREILDPVNSNALVMLPPDEDMKADLTIPTWEVKTGAVIAMEPKKQLVKRMRRSPDVGDCTAITFWPSSAGRTRIKIHEYSQTSFREGEWAPEPNHRPVRPEQRLQREESILGQRQRNEQRQRHVYAYSDTGWDEEQFS